MNRNQITVSHSKTKKRKKNFFDKILDKVHRLTVEDYLNAISKTLPHAIIVIALMLLTFFAIDRVNKPMGFMTNEFHKILTFILCISSLYYAINSISSRRQQERASHKRRVQSTTTAQSRPKPHRFS